MEKKKGELTVVTRAKDIFIIKGDMEAHRQRLEYQRRALTDLRME